MIMEKRRDKSGLDIERIKEIVEIFKFFDEEGVGELDVLQFEGAVAAIFEAEEDYNMMPGPLSEALKEIEKEGFDGFLNWYAFAQFNDTVFQPAIFAGGINSAFSVENLAEEY